MQDKSFWVMSNSIVSNEDVKALTLLYQPLIGSDGLGCYLMLNYLLNPTNLQTDVYSMQYLLDLLNFNSKQLTHCLDKLNAIGLLTTFLRDEVYLFRINMPLKARQFLLDTVLGPYLKSEIGEENFDNVFSYFSSSEISKKGYKNITKAFDEVYTTKTFSPLSSERFVVGRKKQDGIIIRDTFDFESFYETLPIRLKKRRIYTKQVVSQIAAISYVYKFNQKDLVHILSLAYDEKNSKIFAEKIGVIAKDYFEENYDESEIAFLKRPDFEHEVDLTALRPEDLLVTIDDKMTNNSVSLNTIREFVQRNAVDIGLLNGVILASIKYTEHVPSIVYLEKVLADWLSRGIKTGEDAMAILKGIDKRPKRRKSKRVVTDEPEWLDEILDSLKEEDD